MDKIYLRWKQKDMGMQLGRKEDISIFEGDIESDKDYWINKMHCNFCRYFKLSEVK